MLFKKLIQNGTFELQGMLYKAMKNLRGMDRVKINVMFALSSSCLKELHVSGNVDVVSYLKSSIYCKT